MVGPPRRGEFVVVRGESRALRAVQLLRLALSRNARSYSSRRSGSRRWRLSSRSRRRRARESATTESKASRPAPRRSSAEPAGQVSLEATERDEQQRTGHDGSPAVVDKGCRLSSGAAAALGVRGAARPATVSRYRRRQPGPHEQQGQGRGERNRGRAQKAQPRGHGGPVAAAQSGPRGHGPTTGAAPRTVRPRPLEAAPTQDRSRAGRPLPGVPTRPPRHFKAARGAGRDRHEPSDVTPRTVARVPRAAQSVTAISHGHPALTLS